MKVLWFSNTPAASDEYVGSNGTGGWLKSLDKAIQNEIDLHIAFLDKKENKDFVVGNTTYHTFAVTGIKGFFKKIKARLGGQNQFSKRWRQIIEEVNPDIIHIHGAELGFIEVVKFSNRPTVLSIQGIVQLITYKYFGNFNHLDLGLFYPVSKYYRTYIHFLRIARIEASSASLLKYVIGRTDWDRRCFSILAPKAQYYKNNEVLREGFYLNSWIDTSPNDGKYIIFTTTGRLLFKGLETLCLALTKLQESGLHVEWRIAGINPTDEVVKITKRHLKNKYPTEGLVFLGSTSEDDLIKEMLKAHVFAYPSHQDNSSNALCEAMILGMPCVSTFAGGCGSMLTDKVNGVLVQDGDPWAFAGAIKELILNRELACQYGTQAKFDATKRHDKDVIVKELVKIYQDIHLSEK